ncbi:hypothetical protein JYT87_03985 [Nitrospira defluvii]|nr:hypothetical protein [Nitrospira defluvii]
MIKKSMIVNVLTRISLCSLIVFSSGCSLGSQKGMSRSNTDLIPGEKASKEIVEPLKPEDIKVEMFLAKKWKKDDKIIKGRLKEASVKRIIIQYFRFGDPPTNIVIGKDIPADIARLAINIALTYNKDIKTILPEFRFFPHYIAIGSSAFDEQAEIPIFPEDLARLRDPSLSTEEFHTLYRSLTGEDQELQTY